MLILAWSSHHTLSSAVGAVHQFAVTQILVLLVWVETLWSVSTWTLNIWMKCFPLYTLYSKLSIIHAFISYDVENLDLMNPVLRTYCFLKTVLQMANPDPHTKTETACRGESFNAVLNSLISCTCLPCYTIACAHVLSCSVHSVWSVLRCTCREAVFEVNCKRTEEINVMFNWVGKAVQCASDTCKNWK